MSTWNTQYKQNPPNDNNPGYGAESIRDLKTNIEGIVGNEHNFDLVTTSGQGQHRPGSAIVDLVEDTSTKVNNLQVGRLKGSTDVDSKTTLQVKGVSADLDIEGYNQVSKSGDETITGVKTFTSAPAITQIVDDGSSDTTIANVGYVKTKTLTTSITPSVNNAGVPVTLPIKDYENNTITTFNTVTDTNNLEELLVQLSSELQLVRLALSDTALNNPNGQSLKTTDNVTFGQVTATKVYGAVWG